MKILSIDDSSTIRKIIGGSVAMLGYEFLGAENGEEGLKQLEEHAKDISLILLDWNMPVLDGFSTLKKIRENPDYKDIAILMVTTEGEREHIVQALKAGANGYLPKPFSREDLMAMMIDYLPTTV